MLEKNALRWPRKTVNKYRENLLAFWPELFAPDIEVVRP